MRISVGCVLLSFLASISIPAFSLADAADGKKVLLAGAATSNISPPLGELIVGGFRPFPATNIHDELHVRCLVLDNGEMQVGIVICDNLGIYREVYDRARVFIDAETDLPSQNILMAATHTHSATRASGDWYQGFVARRIADCVRCAIANKEPAQIGWGGVDEPSEVFNRRWFVSNPEFLKNPFGQVDKVRMNPPRGNDALIKPAGPIDPEISFVSVQSAEGRPIALLANYSLHYVGGVRRGDVSADYFGIFANRISKLLAKDHTSPPFVGMLSNGTSGDINNINFRKGSPRRQPYEKMTEVAEKVAQRVFEAHSEVKFHDWIPLGAASRDLVLRYRKPDKAMQKHFAEIMAQPEDAPPVHHRYERTYARRVQKLADGPEDVTILLQALRLGDLGIAAIPFEVFVEIGLEIKAKAPFGDAFTIELANGSYGYLPTPAQHELGGYETWMGTCRVQLDASEKITETILDLMNDIK